MGVLLITAERKIRLHRAKERNREERKGKRERRKERGERNGRRERERDREKKRRKTYSSTWGVLVNSNQQNPRTTQHTPPSPDSKTNMSIN